LTLSLNRKICGLEATVVFQRPLDATVHFRSLPHAPPTTLRSTRQVRLTLPVLRLVQRADVTSVVTLPLCGLVCGWLHCAPAAVHSVFTMFLARPWHKESSR
jgi:hypothetical protein